MLVCTKLCTVQQCSNVRDVTAMSSETLEDSSSFIEFRQRAAQLLLSHLSVTQKHCVFMFEAAKAVVYMPEAVVSAMD
jgi:hypothetical protein